MYNRLVYFCYFLILVFLIFLSINLALYLWDFLLSFFFSGFPSTLGDFYKKYSTNKFFVYLKMFWAERRVKKLIKISSLPSSVYTNDPLLSMFLFILAFVVCVLFVSFIIIWSRAAGPRVRLEQLSNISWKKIFVFVFVLLLILFIFF